MRRSKQEYLVAIEQLRRGMTQLDPDGRCCSICGDNDHQAWECQYNPLNIHYVGRQHWRCYHCDAIFIKEEEAREHFGNIPTARTKCIRDKCLCLECTANPSECSGPERAFTEG